VNDPYVMMIQCIKRVSLDIWRVERRDCVWPCWLCRPTSSSTVGTFSAIRALQSAALVPLVAVSCFPNHFQ